MPSDVCEDMIERELEEIHHRAHKKAGQDFEPHCPVCEQEDYNKYLDGLAGLEETDDA